MWSWSLPSCTPWPWSSTSTAVRSSSPEHPAAERLRQQFGAQNVGRGPGRDDLAGEQHDPFGAAGLFEVVRRVDDGRTRRRPLRRSRSGSCCWLARSSPVIGSSRSSSRGEPMRAWATRTRCRWPPDSSPNARRRRSATSRRSAIASSSARSVGPDALHERTAAVGAHAQHLVDHQRQPAVVPVLLGDERDADAVGTPDPALRRGEQAGEQLEQVLFPLPLAPTSAIDDDARDRQIGRRECEHVAEPHRGPASRARSDAWPLAGDRWPVNCR